MRLLRRMIIGVHAHRSSGQAVVDPVYAVSLPGLNSRFCQNLPFAQREADWRQRALIPAFQSLALRSRKRSFVHDLITGPVIGRIRAFAATPVAESNGAKADVCDGSFAGMPDMILPAGALWS